MVVCAEHCRPESYSVKVEKFAPELYETNSRLW